MGISVINNINKLKTKTIMNDTQSHSSEVSFKALKCLVRLSGLRQEFIAEQIGITPVYFWMILNGERKAERRKKQIYNFLIQHNSFIQTLKIAA